MRLPAFLTLLLAVSMNSVGQAFWQEDAAGLEFFERYIRPALTVHCMECHSSTTESSGGLMLDSTTNWELGGDSGEAIVIGQPEASLLIKAIRYKDPHLQMPPDGKLPEKVIEQFERWIELGAIDPRTEAKGGKPKSNGLSVAQAQSHWSYRPMNPAPLAMAARSIDSASLIDSFIDSSLGQQQLKASPPASQAQVIRRLSVDLTGLPPTPDQVSQFIEDSRPDALERLVDSLLASPRFGETFARHWMDVARYAESITLRGFTLPQAWRYRDYLIEAFNDDRPVDHMIVEQIAGDLLKADDLNERSRQLVATAFLALGNTNLEEQDKTQLEMDYIDEQLDVLGQAFLGQTFGCARCHDHKFDPITTRDYYAMAGIFRNTTAMDHSNVSNWIERPLPLEPEQQTYFGELEQQVNRLNQQIAALKKQKSSPIAENKQPFIPGPQDGRVVDDSEAKFVGSWAKSSGVPRFVGEGYRYDENSGKGQKTATFEPRDLAPGLYRVRVSYTPHENRTSIAKVIVFSADGEQTHQINQKVPPSIDALWYELGTYRFEANGQAFVIISNEGSNGAVVADAVQFLPVPNSEKDAAKDAESELLVDSKPMAPTLDELEKQLSKVKSQLATRPAFLTIVEKQPAVDIPVHIRGNVHNLGSMVPRGVPQAIANVAGPAIQMDASASGRWQLARWIADERNPLTARVYANRVWCWLMGQGIVSTLNNFGTTGDRPSHPELLDWLASELIRSQWSTKHLVRCIVMTEAYQRSVACVEDRCLQTDPNNRFLWRGHLRRLSVEQLRDAMLMASGELDLTMGGPLLRAGVKEDYNYLHSGTRRSIYQPVLRNALPDLFDEFDFADTSVSIGQRPRSTVSPQALALMNSPWVRARCSAVADRLRTQASTPQILIDQAFLSCLTRLPTEAELRASHAMLNVSEGQGNALENERVADLVRSLFGSIDFRYLE